MAKTVLLSWSSGKDSAWALHALQQNPQYKVVGLFTTVNEHFERVAMHAVRNQLLQQQADAVGQPLHIINLPWPCSNQDYEQRMSAFLHQAEQYDCLAFGDLFLEDVRDYRIKMLQDYDLEPIFPIWNPDTKAVAEEMVQAGLRAELTCIDPRKIDQSFVERQFNAAFLQDLPSNVDPCGENGEFHSFATQGPMFNYPVKVKRGEVVERDGFVFADLLPSSESL